MAYKYYNQNDYPEIPYGDGSIETSGCGLVLLLHGGGEHDGACVHACGSGKACL